jgi:hypothetical protein
MSRDMDRIRARLRPLASKHHIAHLVALIRHERKGSVRRAQLLALLRALDGRGR